LKRVTMIGGEVVRLHIKCSAATAWTPSARLKPFVRLTGCAIVVPIAGVEVLVGIARALGEETSAAAPNHIRWAGPGSLFGKGTCPSEHNRGWNHWKCTARHRSVVCTSYSSQSLQRIYRSKRGSGLPDRED